MDAQINSHNSTVHALIHCLGSKYERSSHILIKRRNIQVDRETKRGDREMEKGATPLVRGKYVRVTHVRAFLSGGTFVRGSICPGEHLSGGTFVQGNILSGDPPNG